MFDVKEEAFTRLWSRVFTLKFEIQYFFLNYDLNEIWLHLIDGYGTKVDYLVASEQRVMATRG